MKFKVGKKLLLSHHSLVLYSQQTPLFFPVSTNFQFGIFVKILLVKDEFER